MKLSRDEPLTLEDYVSEAEKVGLRVDRHQWPRCAHMARPYKGRWFVKPEEVITACLLWRAPGHPRLRVQITSAGGRGLGAYVTGDPVEAEGDSAHEIAQAMVEAILAWASCLADNPAIVSIGRSDQ